MGMQMWSEWAHSSMVSGIVTVCAMLWKSYHWCTLWLQRLLQSVQRWGRVTTAALYGYSQDCYSLCSAGEELPQVHSVVTGIVTVCAVLWKTHRNSMVMWLVCSFSSFMAQATGSLAAWASFTIRPISVQSTWLASALRTTCSARSTMARFISTSSPFSLSTSCKMLSIPQSLHIIIVMKNCGHHNAILHQTNTSINCCIYVSLVLLTYIIIRMITF